jgi:NAD(P)-dependent dehydrogenase (short-subunit alcohol dehydrogenase family)
VRAVDEQVILVTGATSGLGRELVRELAARGATVLLHARDPALAEAVRDEVARETGNERIAIHLADLASLEQVRALAGELLDRYERLDVLVNNAGVGMTTRGKQRREVSDDGYELRFAVNYLAPFLLTRLLEPLLVRSAPARVVNVASAGQAAIDFDDVMLERRYDGIQAYCQSKLALVMFTSDLAAELRSSGVTVNCLHPGTFMPTKMVLESGTTPITPLEHGVRTTLRLALAPELDGVTGRYFDGEAESAPHPQAHDAGARRRLHELSLQLTGLTG